MEFILMFLAIWVISKLIRPTKFRWPISMSGIAWNERKRQKKIEKNFAIIYFGSVRAIRAYDIIEERLSE